MKRAEIEYGYSPAVDRAVIARVNMNRLEAIMFSDMFGVGGELVIFGSVMGKQEEEEEAECRIRFLLATCGTCLQSLWC